MLRTRKKDINLKPNRILDKRSSRGMLYENEELRLRTIHINDAVDKGQNDIKKLKKENETLKRDLWALRDEYEKLEEVLKRVYAASRDGLPLESPEVLLAEFPPTRLRLNSRAFRRGSALSGTTFGGSAYESEEEDMDDMLMIDEDAGSVTFELESPEAEGSSHMLASPEADDPVFDEPARTMTPAHHHLWQQLNSVSPDLEVVREESENNSNSNNSPMPKAEPDCGQAPPDLANSENPKIQITPASAGSVESGILPNCANVDVQDLGCVTLIPETFSATSELQIDEEAESPKDSVASPTDRSRRNSLFGPNHNRTRSQTLSYPSPNNNVQASSAGFPAFYQSEPSLSVSKSEPQSVSQILPDSLSWSSVDRNVVIGTVERTYKVTDMRAQEIIDELERQYDLAQVAGVRMMGTGPIRIFISLRTAEAVKGLLDKGLKLREGRVPVRLEDASKKCSFLVLSGLPPHLPDSVVVTVLNQFGQVVAPLTRRIYKGVDISERLARMHLVTKVPTVVNIGGYEVPAKICHCQPAESDPILDAQSTSLQGAQSLQGASNFQGAQSLQPTLALKPHAKVHRLIARAISSAPRLETSIQVPSMPMPKRPMSVAGSEHVKPVSGPGKKPLSRAPRSSPGSLVPDPQPPQPVIAMNSVPARSFYRSMSFDPRRDSTVSRFHTLTLSGDVGPEQQVHGRALHTHSSQLERRDLRPKESLKSLPWCGCWGNGCI